MLSARCRVCTDSLNRAVELLGRSRPSEMLHPASSASNELGTKVGFRSLGRARSSRTTPGGASHFGGCGRAARRRDSASPCTLDIERTASTYWQQLEPRRLAEKDGVAPATG